MRGAYWSATATGSARSTTIYRAPGRSCSPVCQATAEAIAHPANVQPRERPYSLYGEPARGVSHCRDGRGQSSRHGRLGARTATRHRPTGPRRVAATRVPAGARSLTTKASGCRGPLAVPLASSRTPEHPTGQNVSLGRERCGWRGAAETPPPHRGGTRGVAPPRSALRATAKSTEGR